MKCRSQGPSYPKIASILWPLIIFLGSTSMLILKSANWSKIERNELAYFMGLALCSVCVPAISSIRLYYKNRIIKISVGIGLVALAILLIAPISDELYGPRGFGPAAGIGHLIVLIVSMVGLNLVIGGIGTFSEKN